MTRTRIITGPEETLIAQLTLTALHVSPVDWASIQMSVEPEPVALDATAIPGPGSCVTFIAPGVDR